MTDTVRKFLLPAASLFQIAGSALPQIFDWGVDIGARSRALDTAIVPAGWAFSIWGIIFLWSSIFAFYGAFQSRPSAIPVNKVAWPAIVAFTMNGVWGVYTPLFGLDIGGEIIIIAGLAAAVTAALIAGRFSPKTTANRYLVAAPLGLLAGWLTAASFVGGSSVLLGMGIDMSDVVLLSILTGTTIFAASITAMRPAGTYVAAVIWALSAIIYKNLNDGNETVVYAAGLASIVLVSVAAVSRLRSSGSIDNSSAT